MAGISVKINGIEDVIANFKKYEKAMVPAMRNFAEDGGKIIKVNAQLNFGSGASKSIVKKYGGHHPDWKTGEIQASIKSRVDGVGNTYAVSHIGILDATKEEAIRSISLEYGHNYPNKGRESGAKTKGQAAKSKPVDPHPFMRPALDSSRAEMRIIAKRKIENAIRSVKAKESHA
jgi:hypothetical protein